MLTPLSPFFVSRAITATGLFLRGIATSYLRVYTRVRRELESEVRHLLSWHFDRMTNGLFIFLLLFMLFRVALIKIVLGFQNDFLHIAWNKFHASAILYLLDMVITNFGSSSPSFNFWKFNVNIYYNKWNFISSHISFINVKIMR